MRVSKRMHMIGAECSSQRGDFRRVHVPNVENSTRWCRPPTSATCPKICSVPVFAPRDRAARSALFPKCQGLPIFPNFNSRSACHLFPQPAIFAIVPFPYIAHLFSRTHSHSVLSLVFTFHLLPPTHLPTSSTVTVVAIISKSKAMAFVSSFTATPLAARRPAAVSSRRVPAPRTSRMSLAPVADVAMSRLSQVAVSIAAKDGDFGGYTGPILGLLAIGIIIAVLTPPVKE